MTPTLPLIFTAPRRGMPPVHFADLDTAGRRDAVRKAGQPAFRVAQLAQHYFAGLTRDAAEMTDLPAGGRTEFIDALLPELLTEVRSISCDDGDTRKTLWRAHDGTLIESVLMEYDDDRRTACISTQAGCAMGCVFCATGQMGFERNLKAEEVVAQVVHIARLLRERGEHVTNVVFMGMGEPLANYTETLRAIRLLTDPRAFGLGQRHVTVSTVGLVHAIDRLAAEDLQIGLAVSLHAANDELRQRLVPTAGPSSVGDLMDAAGRFFRISGRRVTFEYALIEGVNDSDELAEQLARLLKRSGTHVNLIPVNPTAGGFGRPMRARVLAFERILVEAGVNCTVRVEKGSEISAACGQLRTDEAIGSDGTAIALPVVPVHGRRQGRPSPGPSPLQ
jgi:23S rRNA (adenine2503-C2)-methyltransferase